MISFIVVNAIMGEGNIVEPRVAPAHPLVVGNILGKSPSSETMPVGTDVAAAPTINRSFIGILLQTLALQLTGFLPPSSAPQLPLVVPPTAIAEVPPLILTQLDDFKEDILQYFTNGFHQLFGRCVFDIGWTRIV